MGNYYIGKRRRKSNRRSIRALLILPLVFLSLLLVIRASLYPQIKAMAHTEAQNRIERIFHEQLMETLQSQEERIPLSVTYSSEGRVTSATVDSFLLNAIKQETARGLIQKIGATRLSLSLPLSSLLGSVLFAGLDASLPVNVHISERLSAAYRSDFAEKGINQTLLSLSLCITVDVYYHFPIGVQRETVCCEALLYELLIVGEVPDSFIDINRLTDDVSEYDIDDAIDFGGIL